MTRILGTLLVSLVLPTLASAEPLELDFGATLEAGKSYATRIGHVDQAGGPTEMYVWWREIAGAPLEE